MPESHPAIGFIKLFPAEEIPRILQNIQECCKTLSRQTPNEKENSLSLRLFKKLMFFPEYHTGPVVPHWESWLVNVSETDVTVTGRADILFCGGGVQTYFLVEAKRLFIKSANGQISSYSGNYIKEGMMRFTTGQYASKMNAGAMLGYVFDKTVVEAETVLSVAISKKKKSLKVMKDGEWKESSLAVSPSVNETRHEFNQGVFTIYHLLTKV